MEKLLDLNLLMKYLQLPDSLHNKRKSLLHQRVKYLLQLFLQRTGITLQEQTSCTAAVSLNNILLWMLQIHTQLPSLHI
jgi:hypothetical protein